MCDYKLVLETIELSNSADIKAMQKKLNQWSTQGILLKFTTVTAGNNVLFTVALRKVTKVKEIPEDDAPF